MSKQRDHYHVTPSERKRAWAAHERAKARLHKHVCEWCPADDIYTCTKSPCQHLKKKPCPSHKWNVKKGLAPERMDFAPPPIEVHISQYADYYPILKINMTAVEKKVISKLIGDADGGPYPDNYQGKGFTAEKIEEMIKAGDDASECAKYEDFI